MRVPAAVSDSTVFSSGYLEMIWRITRRASPRYSWARGRRASRRSVGQSWCERGRTPGPPGKPACRCLRAPDPRGETVAAQSPLRASLGCWPVREGQTVVLADPVLRTLFMSSQKASSCLTFKLQPRCPPPPGSPPGHFPATASQGRSRFCPALQPLSTLPHFADGETEAQKREVVSQR